MFPQLARADTEAAVRAADARVPGRKFLRRIATKEIRKANEPESLANVEHGGHMGWIVGDVAEAMNRREQAALEEKKKHFQEEDLARAFERYLHEREQKQERGATTEEIPCFWSKTAGGRRAARRQSSESLASKSKEIDQLFASYEGTATGTGMVMSKIAFAES